MLTKHLLLVRFILVNFVALCLLAATYLQGWLAPLLESHLSELLIGIALVFYRHSGNWPLLGRILHRHLHARPKGHQQRFAPRPGLFGVRLFHRAEPAHFQGPLRQRNRRLHVA